MIEEAQQHFESGNFAAAEVLYRKMLEDEPDNPQVLFMLSLTRQGQNDLEEPVELLNHAIRLQPDNPSLHYALGNLALRRKRLAEAENAFHKAVGIDPNFVAAQNGIAIVELSRGRFAAAEHALRKSLKSEPDNPHTLLNMGIALLEQQRGGDAIGYLQQVVSGAPENLAAQVHLGRAFLAADNPGFAIKCFQNALELKPGAAEILQFLAHSQAESRQFAEAAGSYRKLLRLGGETAECLAGLARSLVELGQDLEAEGLLVRALKLSNGEERLLLDYAGLLLRQGKYRDVIIRLDGRIAEAADAHRMIPLLAEAKLKLGDAAAVIELLRPMLSEGAPSPHIRLLFAQALLASGEKAAADAQLDRLMQMDPAPVAAVLFRAGVLQAEGSVALAVELLRGIQRRHDLSHPQRQETVALLASALHRSGNYQAAWEQSLGLDLRTAEVISIRAEVPLQLEPNEPAETAMQREVAWSWPPQPPQDGRPEPIFVFAWPGTGRAGMLDALAGHSGICVVNDHLSTQKKRRLEVTHPQGRGPLNAMTTAEIQLARRKYWKAVRQSDARAGEVSTVDALWLTAESLPTLYRRFPQARLLVLEQDPRDQAVAWLQAGYQDLQLMAARYKQQLELLNRCRAGVPLNYIDVDASRLADDAGSVLREVISALSLGWESAVEQAWREAMPARDLAAAGDWAHYEPWLQPVFETLQSGQ